MHGTRIILSTSSNKAWDMITVLFAPAGRRETGKKPTNNNNNTQEITLGFRESVFLEEDE